jgi:hypothetical protein
MIRVLLLTCLTVFSLFGATGRELFEQKCTSCHFTQVPSSAAERQKLVAPPIGNVLFHLDQEFKTPQEIKDHIVDITLNPTMDKAICNSVKRFGLMPSQKDAVTQEELNQIAEFLINIIVYSKNTHRGGCSGKACGSKAGHACASQQGGKGGCANCQAKEKGQP